MMSEGLRGVWRVQEELRVDATRPYGPLLSTCPAPGCNMLTMGGTCVAHDPPVTRTFPSGRPHLARDPHPALLAKER